MNLRSGFVLSAILLLCASSALADIQGSVKLDSNYPGAYLFYLSTPVAPYHAYITYGSDQYWGYVVCLDSDLPSYVGQTYSGKWVVPSSTTEEEAAYLTDQLYGLTNTADPSFTGPISFAIWHIINNADVPPDSSAQTAAWVTAAQNAVTNGFAETAYMEFIPDDKSSQRFMIPVAVPEPGALILLGTCVLLTGALRRKMFN